MNRQEVNLDTILLTEVHKLFFNQFSPLMYFFKIPGSHNVVAHFLQHVAVPHSFLVFCYLNIFEGY